MTMLQRARNFDPVRAFCRELPNTASTVTFWRDWREEAALSKAEAEMSRAQSEIVGRMRRTYQQAREELARNRKTGDTTT